MLGVPFGPYPSPAPALPAMVLRPLSSRAHDVALLLALMLTVQSLGAGTASAQRSGRTRTVLEADTLPARRPLLTRSDVAILGGSVALTGLAFTIDRASASAIDRTDQAWLRHVNHVGESLPMLVRPGVLEFAGGAYAVGRLTGRPDVADAGWHVLTAVGAAGGSTALLKLLIGRSYPSYVGDSVVMDFKFGGGAVFKGRALPSGHAAMSFAAASAASAELRRLAPRTATYVSPLLYAGATAVGVGTLYHNNHWVSDVVLGTGIGIVSGWSTVRFTHAHPRNAFDRLGLGVIAVPTPGGITVIGHLGAPAQ